MSTTREIAERIVATLLYGPVTDYDLERRAVITDGIDKALQAERENAAKIADSHYHDGPHVSLAAGKPATMGYRLAAHKIAAAIREGKPQE